jgi:hypothetical protein
MFWKFKGFPIPLPSLGPKPVAGPANLFPHPHEDLAEQDSSFPNRKSTKQNMVQTSIGDSIGVIFLLCTIGEQNPYI